MNTIITIMIIVSIIIIIIISSSSSTAVGHHAEVPGDGHDRQSLRVSRLEE